MGLQRGAKTLSQDWTRGHSCDRLEQNRVTCHHVLNEWGISRQHSVQVWCGFSSLLLARLTQGERSSAMWKMGGFVQTSVSPVADEATVGEAVSSKGTLQGQWKWGLGDKASPVEGMKSTIV